MPDTQDRAGSPEYAGPTFYKAPSPSSLPIPNFNKRSSTVSGVRTQLTLRARTPDTITHLKQASSDSEKSGTSSTKSKSVSFTSDTKSHDGKRAIPATSEQYESSDVDMARDNASRCSNKSCLAHHVQKANTTISASAQRSTAFEKLAKRIREDNEAQAKRGTSQHQTSELFELRQHQQAVINRIEQKSTKVIIRYTPQEMIDIRDNVQRQAGELQQMWQRTKDLPQLAVKRLEQNLAEQQEILQQRLDQINEEIEGEEGNLADDEMSLTSSSDDETTLVGTEIDRDEHRNGEVIPASNLSRVANFLETISEESEETAVEDGGEAGQETPEAEETEEAEEEAEDMIEIESSDDEGYQSMEEMEEQEDEGYFSMEE